MFKLFFIYPLVLFIVFWLASDVKVGASVYSFEDNHISIEFPKATFRSEENPEPWYSFYWNAESARDELKEINDAVVK
ncbi:hypothetical protein CW745_14480 [Psychromonas sp. psych-6C06]|uniref:hypothetical protein n=1 Tax=Psychromonas sp. psych-6C06 TaxID=2058089 RepID=UPI000C31D3E3|nr:hypothetical protein [Psychromonas sp. psych-6C06]PKF60542.1 hypothetical protein CW745_14480 [Psychromonas sp. psych-6C06]